MKAIIFDLDNTLIEWKDEFIEPLKTVLKRLPGNYDEEMVKKIDKAIEDYDNYINVLTRESMLDYINKTCNLDLPMNFIDDLIIEQGNCYYEDKELVDTLEYLSKKYDLYVISNWFTDTQVKRLENMRVSKYFKKIVGSDINYFKPNIHTFDVILNSYKSNECVSIGDNLEYDVLLPIKLGMHAIWKTKNNSEEYQTIKNVYELKNIL